MRAPRLCILALATQPAISLFTCPHTDKVLKGGHCVRRIAVTFYDEKDRSEKTVRAVLGQSLMEAAHANEVDLEGVSSTSLQVATN